MLIFMRKLFLLLHKWLSIPAGLIIFIICLSGSILVFQDEIQEVANPERYFNQPPAGMVALPLDSLIPIVNAQLVDNKVKDVRIFNAPNRNYAMGLAEGFRFTAYVNPYTGKIIEIYKFRESPFFWVMSLHRWLLDDTKKWGKYSVGIATLMFIVILITGLIVWFPKRWKKNKFTIETKKGRKRLFYDLHNVLGAYAFLLLLVSAATGPMWSFDWYRNGVYKLFGAKTQQEQHGGGDRKGEKRKDREKKEKDNKEERKPNFAMWQKVADDLIAQNPDFEYVRVQNGSAAVHQKNASTSRATDKYEFDKKTGEITLIELYKNQKLSAKIPGWQYDLHVGNYWGIWSKILTFIAGLIGASLPLTGYYLWWTKSRRKKKTHSSKK